MPHRAAPDAFHHACVWIAAVVLSGPLFAWGGRGIATGCFWIPPFFRSAIHQTHFATGREALILSIFAILGGVCMFLHVRVRDIDGWRDRVDGFNRFVGAVTLLVLSVDVIVRCI